MSALHKYRVDLTITLAGVEREWAATIIYARHKGHAGDRTSPAENDSVEIVNIKMEDAHGRQVDLRAEVYDAFCDDEEIIALLLRDWADDEAGAAEYRAEARAEDRLMGDDRQGHGK